MPDTDRKRDSLPDAFVSENEAGMFWDSHPITDYEEYLETTDVDVDLQARHFEGWRLA